MEPVTIEVERIDPAEALRLIREHIARLADRTPSSARRTAYEIALLSIDKHWPNGAQP